MIFSFQATKPSFIVYYNEHRDEFEKENPDVAKADLTKIAMSKYKQIYSSKANGSTPNNSEFNSPTTKRKISADEGERSGIAKLAKFRKQ